MHIIVTAVSSLDYENPRANPARVGAGQELIRRTKKLGAHLLVLPGGYLCVRTADEVTSIVKPLVARAKVEGVGLVVGINIYEARAKQGRKGDAGAAGFPFWVVGVGTDGAGVVWQQRSTSRDNGKLIRPSDRVRHCIRVGSRDVDLLACGELFSPLLRHGLGPWRGRVILVPWHTAHGSRFFHAVRWANGEGAVCARAVHVANPQQVALGVKARRCIDHDDPHVVGWSCRA